MHRAYHRWYSPALGRDMELLVFGHAGAVASLAGPLEAGHLQLFCVDQIDLESWYGWGLSPAQRARRYAQYDAYLLNEVVPFTRSRNASSFLIVTGPSFGAYHAVNFALRHPEQVGRVLGISGIYDIRRFTGDHYDANVYFNNPVDYLANEHDPGRLAALRRLDIVLAVGRDDPLLGCNQRLSEVLWSKNIWHALRVWDGFAHDWPVWARMLPLYIGGHD
jgi:esterase/lipase superfamily enzyme